MAKKCYKILDFLHENFPPLSIIPLTNLPPPFRIPKADSSPEYLPPPLGRAGVGIPPLPWGGVGGGLQGLLFQKVRSQTLGPFQTLLHLPFFNLCFVAAEQNLGHLPSFVVSWTGIDGCSQQVILETV